ncbi:MAG: bifunctional nuclease family protein [Chloroflexi bacterium]|nr:bifunctional nuclease family protein [Chloroflexota bacterium]
MIELLVEGVRSSFSSRDRLVMLKERDKNRYLPIRVGEAEAFFIVVALQKVAMPRPLTPDLLISAISHLGAQVVQVVITNLTDGVFHARIILDQGGRHIEVDARSSDAIALALRVPVPIFVEENVMEQAAYIPEPERNERAQQPSAPPEEQPEEQIDPAKLEVFRQFISSLDDLDNLGKPDR